MNRGSTITPELLEQTAGPSMRPRFMNRGSTVDTALELTDKLHLQ